MQSLTSGFVISRSSVQPGSPAPFKINHLQTTAGTFISRVVGNRVPYPTKDLRILSRLAVYPGVLALVFLLVASSAFAQERSSLVIPAVVFVGAQALDLHSTHVALSNGHVEANLLMRGGTAGRIAVKVGTSAATLWIARTLARKGRPRAAKVTLYAMTAATAGIALNNYRIARR